MFNDLERIFNLLDWDASVYQYSRPILDSKPYQIVKDKDKSSVFLNALGVRKDDIKLNIDRQRGQDYLTISGESKNEILGKTYSVSGRFLIDSDTIDKIEYDTVDGVLIVDIKFKESEKVKVEIKKK